MKEVKEWLQSLLFSVVVVGVLMIFIQPTLVKGDSMFPTIQENNYLVIEKVSYWFRTPVYGEVIVFKSHLPENSFKNKDLIKRIIGLPGDAIKIKDGLVYRNGEALQEPYIAEPFTFGDIDVTVPADSVFILGDNRAVSRDSRDPAVGFVPMDSIRGRILVRLFPFNEIGAID